MLRHNTVLHVVDVGLAGQHFPDRAEPCCAHGSLVFLVELGVDVDNISSHIGMVFWKVIGNEWKGFGGLPLLLLQSPSSASTEQAA
jgi:hypothetical protein